MMQSIKFVIERLKMAIQWQAKWDRVDAITHLIIDPNLLAEKTPSDAAFRSMIEKAFLRYPTRLNEPVELNNAKHALQNAIYKLRGRMTELLLIDTHKMPGILWARVANESAVRLCNSARRELDGWKKSQRVESKPFLFRYRKVDGETTGDSMRKRNAYGESMGFDTLTAIELFTANRKKLVGWPYSYKWVLLVKKHKKVSERLGTNTHQSPTENKTNDRAVARELTGVKKKKVHTSRSRRTLKDVQRACGSNVVAELEKCLTSELKSNRSVLQVKGRNRRPYDCDLSLDDLIIALKRKYKVVGKCSHNTLKSALPFFVSCPRGRPAGISLR
jgi:hypothetical protein